jgi:hypothetical protein
MEREKADDSDANGSVRRNGLERFAPLNDLGMCLYLKRGEHGRTGKEVPLAFFGSKFRTCRPSNDTARDSATYACPERERLLQV